MNEANQLVLTTIIRAVSENTAEINDGENWVYPLKEESKASHFHQVLANFYVVHLNVFKLFWEFSLLLHVTSFLFATTVSHFLSNIIYMIRSCWILILEKTHSFLAGCLPLILILVWISVPSTSLVRILNLRTSSIVTLTRKSRFINWFNLGTLFLLILTLWWFWNWINLSTNVKGVLLNGFIIAFQRVRTIVHFFNFVTLSSLVENLQLIIIDYLNFNVLFI